MIFSSLIVKTTQNTINTIFSISNAILFDRFFFFITTYERDLQKNTRLHYCLHYLINHVTKIDESLKNAHFEQYQLNEKTLYIQFFFAIFIDYVKKLNVFAIDKTF